MKQKSWINAHVHMYEYLVVVARILVPDNCKTAVVHNGALKTSGNETYQEMGRILRHRYYPGACHGSKDKPNAEGQ